MFRTLALLSLFSLTLSASDPVPAVVPAPVLPAVPVIAADHLPSGFASADLVFDLRLDELTESKGSAAGFRYLDKLQANHPSPHAQASYALYLLGGKNWGAPDGQEARGIELAIEAFQHGSERAMQILGWELINGFRVQRDFQRGMAYLKRAANSGDAKSASAFGEAYLINPGLKQNLTLCDYWFFQAAYNGEPFGLRELADAYVSGQAGGKPNLALAAKYYYQAYVHGHVPARGKLEELAKGNDPTVHRYYDLVVVWRASHGQRLPTQTVSRAATELEQNYPLDPEVLYELALLYEYGRGAGFMDYEKSAQLLNRAIAQGSLDARSQHAYLLLNGYGMKKDPAGALAEWHALELKNNAAAFAQLAYHRYWGLLPVAGYAKDPAMAFYYAQRAAEDGDPFGAYDLGSCYGDGIGVKKDYALAAKYYRVAFKCHVLGPVGVGQSLIDRYLAFAN